jgi:hypothetical protein
MKLKLWILSCLLIVSGLHSAMAQQMVWQWAQQSGGTGWDIVNDMAADSAGNIYTAGSFMGTARFGNSKLVSDGDRDAYFAKYSPEGKLMWAQKAGGKGYDYASCIQVAANGNIYIAGGHDKLAGFGKKSTSNKAYCLFVAAYNPKGELLWLHSFNGYYGDYITTMKTDQQGNIAFAGYFGDKLAMDESTVLKSQGRSDAFVALLDSTGNLRHSESFGGTGYDKISSLCTDAAGNVLVAGTFQQNITIGNTSLATDNAEQNGLFIAWLNSLGEPTEAHCVAKGKDIQAQSLLADKADKLYLAGNFADSISFDQTGFATMGSDDGFVAAFAAHGFAPLWTKQIGGQAYDHLFGMTAKGNGNICLAGSFSGRMEIDGNALETESYQSNLFATELNKLGQSLWAVKNGGTAESYPKALLADRSGNLIFSGSFRDTAMVRKTKLKSSGDEDIFLSKLYNCAQKKLRIKGDTLLCQGNYLKLDAGKGYELYQWSNGATERYTQINTEDRYMVKATDSIGCNLYDTLQVRQVPRPEVAIGKDTSIYNIQAIAFMADRDFDKYQWNNQTTTRSNTLSGKDLGEGEHKINLLATDQYGCTAEASLTLTVKNIEYADANALQNASISIFPNPSNGIINWNIEKLNFEKIDMSVVNSNGTVVWRKEVQDYIKGTDQIIDLQHLTKGTYYIRFQTIESSVSYKIVLIN